MTVRIWMRSTSIICHCFIEQCWYCNDRTTSRNLDHYSHIFHCSLWGRYREIENRHPLFVSIPLSLSTDGPLLALVSMYLCGPAIDTPGPDFTLHDVRWLSLDQISLFGDHLPLRKPRFPATAMCEDSALYLGVD